MSPCHCYEELAKTFGPRTGKRSSTPVKKTLHTKGLRGPNAWIMGMLVVKGAYSPFSSSSLALAAES